jgi:predicted DNA-binding mobile mystery protein A
MAKQTVKSGRARRALDPRLAAWREFATASGAGRPSGGWVQAIREALGMSAQDLADRLGVAGSTVGRLERSEQAGRIRLDTLERVAQELNCDLVYALVPRRPLEQVVDDRARELAAEEMVSLGHTMDLEAQGLSADRMRERLESMTEERKNQPGLWRSHQPA